MSELLDKSAKQSSNSAPGFRLLNGDSCLSCKSISFDMDEGYSCSLYEQILDDVPEIYICDGYEEAE